MARSLTHNVTNRVKTPWKPSLCITPILTLLLMALLLATARAAESVSAGPLAKTRDQSQAPLDETLNLPGLSFAPPSDWQSSQVTTAPVTATNDLTGTAVIRLISPDEVYYLNVIVDWFTSPPDAAIFGNYAMPPDSRYQESVIQLPSGYLVQIMRATTAFDDPMSLLAHAAFRSDRGSYVLSLYGRFLDEQTWNVFSEMLTSMTPDVAALPAAAPLAEIQLPALAPDSISPSALVSVQGVPYDRDAAVQYANTFVNLFDNSDDCYLWYNGQSLLCYYDEGHWGVDGAHFVNRALKAGGLPAPDVPSREAKLSDALRTWLLDHGGQEVGTPDQLQPGDVIFFGHVGGCDGRTWGWTGVVIDQNGPGARLHLHSRVSWTPDGPITNNWAYARWNQVAYNECGQTNIYSFVHINSTQEEPGPLVSQSLTRSPATPFAEQPVQATFQVCNYGGAPFDTDQLYVYTSAPGTHFPSVDPPTLEPGNPGGCYDYDQSATAFPSSGWYTIRAGYVEDGQFLTLDTVAGQINEQTLYVVSPDDIQIQGQMVVDPAEVQQGGTVAVRFTARNTSSATVTDRFRVRVYDDTYPDPASLVAEFPESGDVSLAPDGIYSYDSSLALDTPGIYWVVGEHWAGGNWQPVYGDSVKTVRVLYPMPSPPKLAKGMPPYIALAGEPVNTGTGNFVHKHTDLVIPLPGVSFDLTRYYNHIDAAEIIGPFGHGSTWSLGWHVAWRDDKTAVLTYPDGRETYLFGQLDPDDPFNLAGEYVGQFAETQTLVRNEDGTAVLRGNDQLVYEFDVNGRLARVHDASGNGFDISWDSASHIEKVVHSSGALYNFVYTGDYVTAISSPDGYSLKYSYSSEGDLLSAVSASGDTLHYAYDEQHRVETIHDQLGQRILLNEYNGENRVSVQINSSQVRSTFAYPAERVSVFHDDLGTPITYTYDTDLRVIRIEDARGAVTQLEYDQDFNRIKKIDPLGYAWRWAYDDHARVISSTNPLGATWLYKYDERGNLLQERDPLRQVTTYEYDNHDNLVRETDAEGGVILRTYDERGLVLREENPIGAVKEFTYNDKGLPLTISDAMGVTSMTYDVYGNRITYTDAEGRTTTSTFDDGGRATSTTGPTGVVITFTHDANGNLLAESDGMGHFRYFTYDEQDRLSHRTDWMGSIWTREYDALDRVTREQDPLGGVITYTYDVAGNVVARRDVRGGLWRYEYDLNNRLIREIDPMGHETRYEYDAAGQRTSVDRPCDECPGGRAVEHFAYDLAGQLSTHTDGRGYTTRFLYDRTGRQVEEIDALGYSTRYKYNARGDLIQIIDALGNITYREYNTAGWLVKETDRLGYTTVRSYDCVGNLTGLEDARGNQTYYEYDATDRLVREIDALGNDSRYDYDARGNLLKKTDALERATSYTYDANGNLGSVTNPRGYTTTYFYDALGRRVQMIDALGGITAYTYNTAGDLLAETDPLGCVRSFTYDLVGHRVTATDANGNTSTLEYDSAGNLAHFVDPLNGETTWTYDANNNKLTETNALGFTTAFGYDALNRQVTVIDVLGGISTRTYDPLGHLIKEVDANLHATQHAHDAEGRRTSTTDALTHTAFFEYDGNDNLTKVTDRNGHVTEYTYDVLNRQIILTSALGYTQISTYDAVGNMIELVNLRGFSTYFEYDGNNNRILTVDALNGQSTVEYDALDRPTAITDANGHTTTSTYDPTGNVLTITRPEGQVVGYTYDCEHNRLTSTNAKGYTTVYTYDALYRLVTTMDPLGHVTATEYDAIGQKTYDIDANSHGTRYAYDALGRLVNVTDALGYVTTYTYDPVGNRLTETDANSHTITSTYDAVNRLLTETNPLGAVWSYTYDPEGNLVQVVDANNQTITYDFDAADQLIAIHYPTASQDVAYERDPNGNLVRMTDVVGTTLLDYDALDRQISKTDPYGRTTHNGYDPVGNRLSLSYPSGDTVSYTYNANDWLVAMADPNSGVTTYSYDPDGLPTHTDFSNGTWADQDYDIADRLVRQFNGTSHHGGVVTSYEYTLDAVGNRLQTIEQYTSGQVRTIYKTYQYNHRYEVLQAIEAYEGPPPSTVTTSYAYDPVGNRLAMTTNRDLKSPVTTNYTYDDANRLITVGSTTYTYDANGNRLSKLVSARTGTQGQLETYQYDFENRLTLYTRSREGGKVEQRIYNTYDGLGRRLSKGPQAAQGTIKWQQYTVDGLGYDQLAEYPQTGKPRITQFYRGRANQLVSMDEIQSGSNGSQYWFAADGLRSVAATTKQNGMSSHEFFYDPYGLVIDENGHWDDSSSWTDPHNHYLLTGKEWDEESRLYYFGARFYDAEAGVWLTQDPYRGNTSSPMTRHRTLYVRNNPINRIDPQGFFDFQTGAVEWGDTWESIATQWGTTAAELQSLNPWIGMPKVGDYLQLPDCRSAQCQLQLGITEVQIGGMAGTECGQRLVQRQKQYLAWVAEQRRLEMIKSAQEELIKQWISNLPLDLLGSFSQLFGNGSITMGIPGFGFGTQIEWLSNIADVIHTMGTTPKFSQFMGSVIKYQGGVRGARRVVSLAPFSVWDTLISLGLADIESAAQYTVGDNQGKAYSRFMTELLLNVPIQLVTDLAGDVGGSLAGSVAGGACIELGIGAGACAAGGYFAGNVATGFVVESTLNAGRDWLLDQGDPLFEQVDSWANDKAQWVVDELGI